MEPTVTIELCVRSLAPRYGQDSVIERLERLDAVGRIDDFEVTVWGDGVGLSTAAAGTEAGEAALDRIEAFREWAGDTDRCVESVFQTHTVDSEFTGERYTTVRLPTVALAEYHDDELVHVAPCTEDGTVRTVQDRLDHLTATIDHADAQGDDRGEPMVVGDYSVAGTR